MTNLLHINERSVTFRNKCSNSHRQLQCTLQLVCKDRVLFVWDDIGFSLCGQQHTKCERAICLVYPFFCCKLPPSFSPPNKNLTELGLEIQTVLSRQSFRIRHAFTMTDTVTSQNIDLTFWISLYNEAVSVLCQTN